MYTECEPVQEIRIDSPANLPASHFSSRERTMPIRATDATSRITSCCHEVSYICLLDDARLPVGTGDHHGRGRWDRFPVNGRAGVPALARPRPRPVGPP